MNIPTRHLVQHYWQQKVTAFACASLSMFCLVKPLQSSTVYLKGSSIVVIAPAGTVRKAGSLPHPQLDDDVIIVHIPCSKVFIS